MTREPAALYWRLQIAGWSVHTALNVIFAALGSGWSWPVTVNMVLGGLLALAASHTMRSILRGRGWLRLTIAKLLPRVVTVSVAEGLALTSVQFLLASLTIRKLAGAPRIWAWFIYSALIWSLALFLWAAVYLTVAYFRRYESAQREMLQFQVASREAELQALKAQLNPHFLFNSLNGVRSMILQNPERAQDMLTELSELLRYALQSGARQKVPLREELAAVESYLALERTRFEERLEYRLEAPAQTLSCELPPMLLQTLVENAMKHGIGRLPEGGQISIAAHCEGGVLRLEVRNSGSLNGIGSGTRLGLENARRRLALLYGDRARLDLRNEEPGLVLASVSLPAS